MSNAYVITLELQAAHLRNLSDEFALEFLRSNPNLVSVNFSHSPVGDETVAALGKSCPKLELLQLKVSHKKTFRLFSSNVFSLRFYKNFKKEF